MEGINQQIESTRAGLGSLMKAPHQKTCCTRSKCIDHDKKGTPIQLGEEGDVCFMESLGPEYKEDRAVIRRVEGIDQIKKELSRYNPPPTLLSKKTI
jgi:hypothetical protein